MNALEHNSFTEALGRMRDLCPSPRAVLCISAHWMTEGTWVTAMSQPKTIHDFYGFPQALFDVRYPAPGSPEIAQEIRSSIADPQIQLDREMWGLDHGAWSVLRHMFPKAEIPVLQLSINIAQPPSYHFALGEKLRTLRERGILIVASGNIVHNLRLIRWEPNAAPYDWTLSFDEWVKSRLMARDFRALQDEFSSREDGRLSVPTMEHYYPLLYAIGASDADEGLSFTFEGIQNGSISMRSLAFG